MLYELHIEDLLNEYFDIDPQKLEKERREILAALRANNTLQDERRELGLQN